MVAVVSIANLVEPVKEFANNAIRIAHVSTDEPAAAPDHLLIFESDSPAGDAWFAFYASPVAQQSFQEHVNAVAFADGEQVLSLNADRRGFLVTITCSYGRRGSPAAIGNGTTLRLSFRPSSSVPI